MKCKQSQFIYLILLALATASCSPYGQLLKDFNNGKTSIAYLHSNSTTGKNEKKDVYVNLLKPTIKDKRFTFLGEVVKVKNEVVPLIIYTGWKHEYECRVGKNQIEEDLETYIQEAFKEESKRLGNFQIGEGSRQLQISIEIDSIGSKGPYVNQGVFLYLVFGYLWQKTEVAGPGQAFCNFHYKVMEGEKILLEDNVRSSSSFEPLQAQRTTLKKFHQAYRVNLIESLGDCIKKNIEQMVQHINILLEE